MRGLLFVMIVAILVFSKGSPAMWIALWLLVGLDLLKNEIDVLLERASRKDLGGLPSTEYLIHIVATFLTGLAVASAWWNSSASGFQPVTPTTFNVLRAGGLIGFGCLMFLIESFLFAKALAAHRRAAHAAPSGATPA